MRESEWFVKRFLLASRRNEAEAYQMLKKTLLWRKSISLSDIVPSDFPKEFYEVGGLFSYPMDKQGMPVIYMRIRMHRKVKELIEPVQFFLFHTIDRVERESPNNSITIVFDCNGAGYSNMDIDLLRNLIDVAFKYFPFCIRTVIVYEMSWMLSAFRKMAMSILPSTLTSLVKFANKNDITNFIELEHLPDFMNGTCKLNYRKVPEGCPSVFDLAESKGFTKKDVDRLMAVYDPLLEEARIAIEEQKEREQQQLAALGQLEEPEAEQAQSYLTVEDNGVMYSESSPIAVVHSCTRPFGEFASVYPQNLVQFRRVGINNPWREGNAIDATQGSLMATIMIRNNHAHKPLAFKIQSNNSQRYSVTPNQGVLLSGAFVCIQLMIKDKRRESTLSALIAQDKFLVLLSPEVDPDRHFRNPVEFNRLFVQNIHHVYSHKLKATIGADESEAADSATIVGRLEERVSELKKRCRRLESKQYWFNLVMIVCVALLMAITLYSFAICADRSTTWHEHIANAVTNFVNPASTASVSHVKTTEL